MDDIVEELDWWLAQETPRPTQPLDHVDLISVEAVQRARDEIVALRAVRQCDLALWRNTRAEALDEAAQACVGSGAIVAEARLCAAAIRALKDKANG